MTRRQLRILLGMARSGPRLLQDKRERVWQALAPAEAKALRAAEKAAERRS